MTRSKSQAKLEEKRREAEERKAKLEAQRALDKGERSCMPACLPAADGLTDGDHDCERCGWLMILRDVMFMMVRAMVEDAVFSNHAVGC